MAILSFASVSLLTKVVYDVYWNERGFNLTAHTGVTKDFYHFGRIDYDRVFRQYAYPKDEKSCNCNLSWTVVERISQDIFVAITGEIGSGLCGYNSICAEINGERERLFPETILI